MRILIFIIKLGLFICVTIEAQTPIRRLENVPKEFIERYQQESHEYNPLHVGDMWQFVDYSGNYDEVIVDMDTIIYNEIYYRKLDMFFSYDSTYFYLERNDSSKVATYRLDIEDLDEDGDSLDEILLDSLEVPHATNYSSYRYTWRNGDPDPKPVVIQGPYWVIVFGDTVMARIASYLFQDDLIADKYGVVEIYPEGSPPLFLTGMIINGIKYGNIVEVDELTNSFFSEFRLENNFPNPFNPVTVIRFYLPEPTFVKLKVFDILGNEIKVINEEKNSGFHEITFDGSELSSGVYFYSLQASKYSETKKMILIR
ncbi:MAG: T9SS type A sorting domain-containing protein [bacterium]|nr:T9SS type A sorting domain-containing protein [bacterium]